MDNDNLMLYGTVAVGALWFFTKNEASENMFLVNGVDVPESELTALGYIKFNGQWFLKTDLIAAAQTNGVSSPGNIDVDTQIGMDIFMTLLTTGLGLTTTIIANTAQRKADLIEQIETKYTSTVSSSFDPDFPFTSAQLQALTIAKLNKILSGDFAISGISEDYNLFYQNECLDGNFSSSEGKGSCSYHGGISGRNWRDNL